ncbi:MAG: flagellar basal body P-ring protein FlgI [Planctomycetota bacterium]
MNAQGLRTTKMAGWLAAVVLLLTAGSAQATKIQDLVTIQGSVENVVTGYGLVVGLDGTGDAEVRSAYRPLVEAIGTRLDENATLDELMDSKSVALVYVQARITAQGARRGSEVSDVTIVSIGDADSLAGGVLVETVLFGPGRDAEAYAVAQGRVSVTEEANLKHAALRGGAQMLRDLPAVSLDNNDRLHLVLNENNASWPLAVQLANVINGLFSPDGPPIAVAVDQRNVIVQLPEYQVEDPGPFITQILVTDIEPELIDATARARVLIDADAGTISFSANVEIRPTSISIDSYTIALGMDEDGAPRKATLQELMDAFQMLNLPPEDRISIVRQLHAGGNLLADLEERS